MQLYFFALRNRIRESLHLCSSFNRSRRSFSYFSFGLGGLMFLINEDIFARTESWPTFLLKPRAILWPITLRPISLNLFSCSDSKSDLNSFLPQTPIQSFDIFLKFFWMPMVRRSQRLDLLLGTPGDRRAGGTLLSPSESEIKEESQSITDGPSFLLGEYLTWEQVEPSLVPPSWSFAVSIATIEPRVGCSAGLSIHPRFLPKGFAEETI